MLPSSTRLRTLGVLVALGLGLGYGAASGMVRQERDASVRAAELAGFERGIAVAALPRVAAVGWGLEGGYAPPQSLQAQSDAAGPDAGAKAPAGSLGLEDAAQQRQALIDWTDSMLAVHPHLVEFGQPGTGQILLKLRADLDEMSDAEIVEVAAYLGGNPGFWELPDLILSLFEPGAEVPPFYAERMREWRSMQGLDDLGGVAAPIEGSSSGGLQPDIVSTPVSTSVPYPTMDPFPPRGTAPPRPPDRGGCPGVFNEGTCDECGPQIPLEAVFAAKVALLIANGVNDTATDSKLDTCLPPGIGFTVPDPVKIIIQAIAAGAEALLGTLEFINDLNEECEGGFHAAIVDLYLDETISSRVSQVSFDAHASLEMRLEIEAALLTQADDRVSLFQLPQAQCGVEQFDGYRFCGKLELVREVVDDTITRNLSVAGQIEINNATAELEAGDMHYMSSQWKAAFERYSKAYRFVVGAEP